MLLRANIRDSKLDQSYGGISFNFINSNVVETYVCVFSVVIHFSYHFWEVINTKKKEYVHYNKGFQSVTLVRNLSANAGGAGDPGDAGVILGLGKSPAVENGYPLQYSCLENSMEKGDWQVTVHGIVKSWT